MITYLFINIVIKICVRKVPEINANQLTKIQEANKTSSDFKLFYQATRDIGLDKNQLWDIWYDKRAILKMDVVLDRV